MKIEDTRRTDAIKLMLRLTSEITQNMGAPMRSSAEVCLEDAEACFDRGDNTHAGLRAMKGLRFLGIHLQEAAA